MIASAKAKAGALCLTAVLHLMYISCFVGALNKDGGNIKQKKIPTGVTFANKLMSRDKLPKYTAPMANMKSIHHEDMERDQLGMPPRYAIANRVPGAFSSSDAMWEVLDDGTQILRRQVEASQGLEGPDSCKSLNFRFKPYRVPPNCTVMIYDPESAESIGPFSDKHNNPSNEFWTPIVRNCSVIIEVEVQPGISTSDVHIVLDSVNVAYRELGYSSTKPQDNNISLVDEGRRDLAAYCHINAECRPDWDLEQRSVAAISLEGQLFCTGFMVNNVKQNFKPYFITAHHCGLNPNNAPSLVTYWNWRHDECEGGTLSDHRDQFVSGASFLANYPPADSVLLQLNQVPDARWGVSYAGWDRSGDDVPSAVAIHHPQVNDGMKISFENDKTVTTSWSGSLSPGDGTHICVTGWDEGTTERGSSGSPLFSPDHRVIGQLHGGAAACGNSLPDWYGKFSVSMNEGGFSAWLDPHGNGTVTVDTISISITCGDGSRDPTEACDGDDFGETTCGDYGFSGGGSLSCTDQCTIVTNDCIYGCGNNFRDDNEECDGEDLGGSTCADLGYTSGTLACSNDCASYDTSQCESYIYGPEYIYGLQGDSKSFCVNLPVAVSSLVVSMTGGTGDGDLLVRQDYPPSQTRNDCMPYLFGNEEQCFYRPAKQGTYCVMVYGYTSFMASLAITTPDPIVVGCSIDSDCNDGIDCTDDTCNIETGSCDYTPIDRNCDDGNFCNGNETCDATSGCQVGIDPCPGFGITCDELHDTCMSCTVEETFDNSTVGSTAGWSIVGSTCRTGSFEIGRPNKVTTRGVTTQVSGDHTSGTGFALYSAPNLRKGAQDIDQGMCVATSPNYTVREESLLSIWYFFGQRNARDDPDDGFRLMLFIRGKETKTVPLVNIGDKRTHATWTYVSAIIPADSQVQVRIEATDGTRRGDFIEAGLDDLSICPISMSGSAIKSAQKSSLSQPTRPSSATSKQPSLSPSAKPSLRHLRKK